MRGDIINTAKVVEMVVVGLKREVFEVGKYL